MTENEISVVETNNVVKIPMLALRGKVVLPDIQTTLDVGRIKSVNAVNVALSQDNLIFVTAQTDGSVENPLISDLFTVGVVCRIKNIVRMSENNMRISIETLYRAKIVNVVNTDTYFEVEVEKLNYKEYQNVEVEAYIKLAKDYLKEYFDVKIKSVKDNYKNIISIEDPIVFANVCTFNLNIKEGLKQEILDLDDLNDVYFKLCEILVSEIQIINVEKNIANKVKASVEQNQKEYYLREQLKAIHSELGDNENEISELEDKIKAKGMPKDVEEKVLKELFRMSRMNSASPDYTVLRTYIDWFIDLPFKEVSKDTEDINLAENILNEDHYGLEKVKERIVEYLAVLKMTKKIGSSIICLYGPPGVGKTSIAKSIARALNRKFIRMSLGGVKDEAEIRGHRKTYIGAMPGRIIYAMKDAGTTNPVILLDEIDKLSSDLRGDPASALLEVLDPEQNSTFRDRYLEVSYDLSNVLFITTANSLDTIPAPLLDRMEVITISGYTLEEKVQIGMKYLVPKEMEKNGLSDKKIEFTEKAIETVVDGYTREAGVRNLEREIGSICRKVTKKLAINGRARKSVITEENVSEYLGSVKYLGDEKLRDNEVGAVTGLAWTSVGGTTLTVEVALSKGKGNLLLTGKLGEVMQESAKIAFTYIRTVADKYLIDNEKFSNYDVHIHVPEGATPKDGPSAGITLATAILSAFTNKKVYGNVAMTGEITLRGKVLAIGGLKEKALAGFRLGIRKIVIPYDNIKDLEEIPNEIKNKMEFIPVKTAEEVFEVAFMDK